MISYWWLLFLSIFLPILFFLIGFGIYFTNVKLDGNNKIIKKINSWNISKNSFKYKCIGYSSFLLIFLAIIVSNNNYFQPKRIAYKNAKENLIRISTNKHIYKFTILDLKTKKIFYRYIISNWEKDFFNDDKYDSIPTISESNENSIKFYQVYLIEKITKLEECDFKNYLNNKEIFKEEE